MPKYENEGIIDNDDLDDDNDGKKKSKLMTSLIAVSIVVIWIAIFALLIKLDVGGFGSSVMKPIFKDVPIINKILPDDEIVTQEEEYPYKSLAEAINYIKELAEMQMSQCG